MTEHEAAVIEFEKTLRIHLSDQRKQIAADLKRAIYGELKDEHPGWCQRSDSPENLCDCAMQTMIEIVAGKRTVTPDPKKFGAWE